MLEGIIMRLIEVGSFDVILRLRDNALAHGTEHTKIYLLLILGFRLLRNFIYIADFWTEILEIKIRLLVLWNLLRFGI